MRILKKKRVPVCFVEDKYIDALLRKDSSNIRDYISVMMLFIRFENQLPSRPDLAKMLHTTEAALDAAIDALVEVGFLKPTAY